MITSCSSGDQALASLTLTKPFPTHVVKDQGPQLSPVGWGPFVIDDR